MSARILDIKKVQLALSPYCALTICSFLAEFREDFDKDKELIGLKTAFEEFFKEVALKTSQDQIKDAIAEVEVNILLGKSPDRKR